MRDNKTTLLVLTGVLAALMLTLNAVGLGMIPLPPLKVTILHIPVIVGALLGGPAVGLALGAVFGIMSMYNAYVAPALLSVCFMNPVVSILPRLLVPILTWLTYRQLSRLTKLSDMIKIGCCAFVGSMTNTLGVLGALGLLYGELAAQSFAVPGQNVWAALGLFGVTAGIPEAIVCTLIAIAVVRSVKAAKFMQFDSIA